MAGAGPSDQDPVRAHRAPRDDARPQTAFERQTAVSTYLLHRAQRRRKRFLQRSRTTTIRDELLRALYLTGCLLVDLLVIPEAIFIVPGVGGWIVAAAGFVVAVWLEGSYYAERFALRGGPPDKD